MTRRLGYRAALRRARLGFGRTPYVAGTPTEMLAMALYGLVVGHRYQDQVYFIAGDREYGGLYPTKHARAGWLMVNQLPDRRYRIMVRVEPGTRQRWIAVLGAAGFDAGLPGDELRLEDYPRKLSLHFAGFPDLAHPLLRACLLSPWTQQPPPLQAL